MNKAYITGHLGVYRLSIGNFLPFMDRSYIIYILIYIIFHFKHDVLITEKPLRGVFNKVLSYLILSYLIKKCRAAQGENYEQPNHINH